MLYACVSAPELQSIVYVFLHGTVRMNPRLDPKGQWRFREVLLVTAAG